MDNDWRRHWQFYEGGAIALRTDQFPHERMHIVVMNGQVNFSTLKAVSEDREEARYFATRLMEAVAMAELQDIATIEPKGQ